MHCTRQLRQHAKRYEKTFSVQTLKKSKHQETHYRVSVKPRGNHFKTLPITAVQDKDPKRSHGQVGENVLTTSDRCFAFAVAFLSGHVPKDLELVFVTVPVSSVKEFKNWQLLFSFCQ